MPLYLLMLPNANVVVVHAFNCICPALLLQEDKLVSTKQSQPCACFVLQAVKQQQQRSPIFAIVRTSFCSRGTCPQITASWLQLDVTAAVPRLVVPRLCTSLCRSSETIQQNSFAALCFMVSQVAGTPSAHFVCSAFILYPSCLLLLQYLILQHAEQRRWLNSFHHSVWLSLACATILQPSHSQPRILSMSQSNLKTVS